MLNDLELENIERRYFDFILILLKQDLEDLIVGLNSRIKILDDWYEKFISTARSGYNASDLDTGAERIFHNFFSPIFHFPNSTPLGSDLMFELPDSIIHIEIKTALINNPADYKGKVNIGKNQTSYGSEDFFIPNLPQYYNINQKASESNNKPCLTYVIQIIHEHAKPDIKALILICIPNGQLYSHYGKGIFLSGKGGYEKGKDFRYKYSEEPLFKLLSDIYKDDKFRVELIYLSKTLNSKDVTNITNIPIHYCF